MADNSVFPHLRAYINKNKIIPRLLELVVTEDVLVDDYSVAEKLLSNVRAIGMSVSVDDFGTGYSSLSYLKMPSDYLIIDHSFIKGMAADDNNKAIIGTIISMAHNLNPYVTAEA